MTGFNCKYGAIDCRGECMSLFAPLTIAECQEFRRQMASSMQKVRRERLTGRLRQEASPLELELAALVRESFR